MKHLKIFENMNKTTLTTQQLRNETWGTPCGPGAIGDADNHLSEEIFIDFVDTFFDGVLNNVEVDKNEDSPNCFWLFGGQPKIKKMTITQAEFDKYFNVLGDEYLDDLSDFLEIKKKKFQNVDSLKKYHPEIISFLFCFLTGMRADYMDNGEIDIESE